MIAGTKFAFLGQSAETSNISACKKKTKTNSHLKIPSWTMVDSAPYSNIGKFLAQLALNLLYNYSEEWFSVDN